VVRPAASDVASLLEELCTDLGFCLPADAERRLRNQPPFDASMFATAVLWAEGIDPSSHRTLVEEVRRRAERTYARAREARA
jgi:hypothetical protein